MLFNNSRLRNPWMNHSIGSFFKANIPHAPTLSQYYFPTHRDVQIILSRRIVFSNFLSVVEYVVSKEKLQT